MAPPQLAPADRGGRGAQQPAYDQRYPALDQPVTPWDTGQCVKERIWNLSEACAPD